MRIMLNKRANKPFFSEDKFHIAIGHQRFYEDSSVTNDRQNAFAFSLDDNIVGVSGKMQ